MIGILGGTFDPIHYGHLHMAEITQHLLHCQEIRFIPCKNPLLGKKTVANEQQRLAMLQRAIIPYPHFCIDKCELERQTPSFTVETLQFLRQKFKKTPLALIIGSDNLTQLNHWHRWTLLIQTSHLVIVPRKPFPSCYHPSIQNFIKEHQTHDSTLLLRQPAGLLFIATVKPLPISSTIIRKDIAQGKIPTGLLPPAVLTYIQEKKLYL